MNERRQRQAPLSGKIRQRAEGRGPLFLFYLAELGLAVSETEAEVEGLWMMGPRLCLLALNSKQKLKV